MTYNRVKAGAIYRYNPVLIDRMLGPKGLKPGDIVKVINRPEQYLSLAHSRVNKWVEKDGVFMGMVCTNSLEKI